MKPLTVGNIVSAGLRIYRDRFFDYYKLALISCLWVLVPLFVLIAITSLFSLNSGDSSFFLTVIASFFTLDFSDPRLLILGFFWFFVSIFCTAKYLSIMGLISRLAFGEVSEKPESIRDAQRFIKPRIWMFLVAVILIILILLVAIILVGILSGILSTILFIVIGQQASNLIPATARIILNLAGFFLLLFALIRLVARLLIVEVPLAIEEDVNALDAISRSWKLTKGSIFRLTLIILLGALISFPITIAIQIASGILQFILSQVASSSPGSFSLLLYTFLTMIISVAGGALLIPFWQSIKAVIYYDLRVRKEGLGLNLEKS